MTYFSLKIDEMLEILLDRIIAEQRKSAVVYVPAADLLVERGQKLLNGGAAVEADHLVRAVEEVHGYRVRQRVVVRILQQDRKDLHARGLHLATAVLKCPLERPLAVGRVLAAFRSEGTEKVRVRVCIMVKICLLGVLFWWVTIKLKIALLEEMLESSVFF